MSSIRMQPENAGVHSGGPSDVIHVLTPQNGNALLHGPPIHSRPLLCAFIIAAADMLAFASALAFGVCIRHYFHGNYALSFYARHWPVLGLFTAAYAMFGLYPGVTLYRVDEIRRTASVTSLVFLLLAAITFAFRVAEEFSRAAFLIAWLISLPLVPAARCLVRHIFSPRLWWGRQVLIIGAGETGRALARALAEQPELGLRPRAVVAASHGAQAGETCGLPILPWSDATPALIHELGVSHAMIALSDVSRRQLRSMIDLQGGIFAHLLIVPDLAGIASLGTTARELGRQLALDVRRNLLLPGPLWGKAAIDLVLTLLLGLLLLPVMFLIALLIKVQSPGPVLCAVRRIGRNGATFDLRRFRSDPATRIGRTLRLTRFDDLPQFWNVLARQMSLVGPKPITEAEIADYGRAFAFYRQVLPGMTGLSHIFDRKDSAERAALDTYYVRNWSVWLDLYLLACPVKLVFQGSWSCLLAALPLHSTCSLTPEGEPTRGTHGGTVPAFRIDAAAQSSAAPEISNCLS